MQMVMHHQHDTISPDNYRAFTEEEFEDYFKQKAKEMGVDDVGKIEYFSESKGELACNIGVLAGNKWYNHGFAFIRSILNGKDHTIYEINDTITHELCHAIANKRYNANLDHDDHRWQDTCREFGYEPSEYIDYTYYVNFTYENLEYKNEKNFTLKCDRCGKLYYQSDEFDEDYFDFFLYCTFDYPTYCDDLDAPTPCCNCAYKFEFDSNALLLELKKADLWPDIQEAIVDFVGTANIERTTT